ncbi:unnamed protein product, partial [Ectocarpus sp. 12 AP-2014]
GGFRGVVFHGPRRHRREPFSRHGREDGGRAVGRAGVSRRGRGRRLGGGKEAQPSGRGGGGSCGPVGTDLAFPSLFDSGGCGGRWCRCQEVARDPANPDFGGHPQERSHASATGHGGGPGRGCCAACAETPSGECGPGRGHRFGRDVRE